jgi:O-antigen/teichoic acid export membrane protein
MFGVNYKDSVYVCLFLAVGIVLWAPSRILASDIAARGLANVNLHNAIYVLIINIVLSVILIYQYGYLGAAVATSIAYSCDFFLRMYAYQKLTHLNVYKEMIPKKQDIEMMIDVAKRKVYAK